MEEQLQAIDQVTTTGIDLAMRFGPKLLVAVLILGMLTGLPSPVTAQAPTAYEGARLIVGDGRVIESATLVVDGAKIAQAGTAADVRVPAGATRVSLTGKTVMPMLIDTHVHLSPTRDGIVRDLRLRAYGVSAALSLGTDTYEMLGLRGQPIPGAARYLSAGRGITMPEPGRTRVPYWITSEAEGRKAVEELAAHKVDIVKIWVDTRDGKYKKLTPELYDAIIALRPDWHSSEVDKGRIKVVYTGGPTDVPPVSNHVRRESQNKAIKARLKDPDDELELVIVKDMMLTGFDAPPCGRRDDDGEHGESGRPERP